MSLIRQIFAIESKMNFSEINITFLKKIFGEMTQPKGPEIKEAENFKAILLRTRLSGVNSWMDLLGGQETSSSQLDPYKGYRWMLDQMILEKNASTPWADISEAQRKKIVEKYGDKFVGPMKNELYVTESSPSKSELRQLARQTARKHGIPDRWFERLISLESNFDPVAVSSKGAMGLGQLMPATARELGLQVTDIKESGENSVWNPVPNLDASARYLSRLHEHFMQKGMEGPEAWNFAAGAYNAGIGNIEEAISHLKSGDHLVWDRVTEILPRVTGKFSGETIKYVENLRS